MPDLWDDEFEDEPQNESDLVKQLRAVIKAGKKKNEEYETELSTLRPAVRSTKLAATLKDLGIDNPKIAGLVPKDIEPTKESLEAWVAEYGDVFNIKTSTSTTEGSGESSTEQASGADGVSGDQAAQWQRIQSQTSQSGATSIDAETTQLAMLQAAVEASNGSSDAYFAFLSGEKAIPTS